MLSDTSARGKEEPQNPTCNGGPSLPPWVELPLKSLNQPENQTGYKHEKMQQRLPELDESFNVGLTAKL